MTKIPLTVTGKTIDLDSQFSLISDLVRLANEWPNLASVNDARSLADFLQTASDRFRQIKPADVPAGVRQPLAAVQAGFDRLVGGADDFANSPAGKLLTRLDRFSNPDALGPADAGLLAWAVDSGNQKHADGAIGFELGASASIAVDADDRWPFRDDIAADPELGLLLSIKATADLKAAAEADVTLPLGGLSAAASASFAPSLAWYFRPDRSRLYGEALAAAIAHLPSPFSASDLWRATQRSDFKGMRLSVPGSFKANVAVAMAAAAELGDVSVKAGFGIGVSYERKANLNLTVRALPATSGNRPLLLRVSQVRQGSSQLGFDVSFGIDATRLAARAARAVNAALDTVDKELAGIRAFATPGALLRDEIAGLVGQIINDEDLRHALLADFGLASDGELGLVAWATGQIEDAIDAEAARVRDFAGTAIDSAAGSITARLTPRLATLVEQPAAQLDARVAALVNTARDRFKQAIASQIANATAPLDAALRRAGVQVNAVLNSIDTALGPVQDLLRKVDDIIADVRDKTALATRAKLQIEMAWEERRSNASEYLIEAEISADSPAIEAVFVQLLKGNFDVALALLSRPDAIPGLTLNRDASWLQRKAAWSQSTALRLSVLGIDFGASLSLAATTLVAVDGNGNLTLTTAARAESLRKAGATTQLALFTASLQASLGGEGGDRLPAPAMSLAISRNHQKLAIADARDFLQRLASLGLVGDTVPTQVEAALKAKVGGAGSQQKLPADLLLRAAPDQDGLARSLAWGRRLADPLLADPARIELTELALRVALRTGYLSPRQVGAAAGISADQPGHRFVLPDAPSLRQLAECFHAYARINWGALGPEPVLADASSLTAHFNACLLFGGIPVDGAQDVKGSPRGVPGLEAALTGLHELVQLAGGPVPPGLAALERRSMAIAERIARGIGYWLTDFTLIRDWRKLAPRLEMLCLILAMIWQNRSDEVAARQVAPLFAVVIDPEGGNPLVLT